MISKLLLAANPWHHAEIIGLLPTEQERNFQLVDVFGPMVDIVKSPTKADEKALWTVRWKDHIVDPFKAREKGITLISVRDGNKTASGEEYAVYFGKALDHGPRGDQYPMISTGMNGTIEQINQWITKLRTISTADLGEGWIQRVGEIEGNLASYLSENYPLLAFPVDGGTVLRGWGGTFWEPEVQGAGGEITPEQGVRLQVKNMRPCHKYTYGDFNKPSARKKASSGEEYAIFFGGENARANDFMLSTGMTGTIEQINEWITQLQEKSRVEGANSDTLCDYYNRSQLPLMAFPVNGGTVLEVLGYPGDNPGGPVNIDRYVITPAQGARFQVRNIRPCREYRYNDFDKPSARKRLLRVRSAKKPKCPSCGSSDYSLMPTDFETAKCNDCGKNWDHGIVKGINEPPKLGSMSKKASYYIPEGYKTPTALAPEMKWLWTPDNGPYVFPMYRMYTKKDRGLKIMCLHEKFCSANGLPSHGYSFDRLDRGYVFSDPSKKLIRISVSGASENIDEALEDMVEEIQYAFPDTAEWRFTTTGPDNRVLRPGLEENDVPRGEKLNHTVDWGLYASTRSKELHWVTADKVQPGDILAMSGTFMAVKKAALAEGGKIALLGEPGQVHCLYPQDKVNVYKTGSAHPIEHDYSNLPLSNTPCQYCGGYGEKCNFCDEDLAHCECPGPSCECGRKVVEN